MPLKLRVNGLTVKDFQHEIEKAIAIFPRCMAKIGTLAGSILTGGPAARQEKQPPS
jgi:hypothetical protein